jgi:hypothetical protein
MSRLSPGVRRLCVCVRTEQPGFLGHACRVDGSGRLYLEGLPAERLELGFAQPGIDEAVLVTDFIAALHTAADRHGEVGGSGRPGAQRTPVLAAFHVGITRVEGDSLGGPAVIQALELLRDLDRATADRLTSGVLAVGVSDSLFGDIARECGFTQGWIRLATTQAWFRVYDSAPKPGAPVSYTDRRGQ